MNTQTVPFRLLIVGDSQQEARRLTSMFQNAGKPCRARHIDSLEGFDKIIEEQRWDLVIAHSDSSSPTPAEALQIIRKYKRDVPLILLDNDETRRSVINGMKLGAADVIKLDDDQHLLLAVERELTNGRFRKNTRVAERKLKELERYNKSLLDSSKDGIAFIQDGTFIYANDSFAEMCGYTSHNDIEYAPLMDLIRDEDRTEIKRIFKNFVLNHEQIKNQRLEFTVRGADGQPRIIDADIVMGQFEEEPCVQLLISARAAGAKMPEQGAADIDIDNATGFHGRTSFHQKLNETVKQVADENREFALIYIDLDKFKRKVENVVGPGGADNVLATTAEFLRARTHEDDFLARVGDDSFTIITGETDFDRLLNTGNAICENIRTHLFDVNNKTVRLTTSIGITLINSKTVNAQAAMNQAIQAIDTLRQKKKGGDGVNIYRVREDDQAILVGDLQKALDENRFRLLFQPIVSLRGDETERYEVKLRMLGEQGEEISPSRFLSTAESMQASTRIDRWALREAIRQLGNHSKSRQEGKNDKQAGTQLVVHISSQTLCDELLLARLKDALKAAKVEPHNIMLQATEVDINDHLTAAKAFIKEATSLGIGFCVSNFGCTLDQEAFLEHIDVEHIKIDDSFTIEIQENPDNTEAMEAVVNTLQSANRIITVPMVENAGIVSTLWKMGVHCIQGNYLQTPRPVMAYEFAAEDSA